MTGGPPREGTATRMTPLGVEEQALRAMQPRNKKLRPLLDTASADEYPFIAAILTRHEARIMESRYDSTKAQIPLFTALGGALAVSVAGGFTHKVDASLLAGLLGAVAASFVAMIVQWILTFRAHGVEDAHVRAAAAEVAEWRVKASSREPRRTLQLRPTLFGFVRQVENKGGNPPTPID
ncbi:MAG TPA: hypothetical protein VHO29_15170 [Marmoricola sp.]|nr:hypothetical protein [Marmoricola sp.]